MSISTGAVVRAPLRGLLVLLCAAVTATVAAALPGGTLGFCALLLFGLAVACLLRREPGLQLIAVTAFAVRAGAALIHAYAVALPDSQLDARTFELRAHEWAMGGWQSVLENFRIGAFTYSWVLSVPYHLLGRSPLMAQSINVLLGTLVVVNVYRLSEHYFNHKTAYKLAWVAAFFPSLVLYSAITMREVFVTYPLTLGLILLSRWLNTNSVRHFLIGSGCFLVAGTFHYAILMCYLVILSVFFLKFYAATLRSGNSVRILIQTLVGAVGIPVVLYAVLNYRTDFGRLADILVDLPKVLKLIDKTMTSRAEGRLAYLENAEVSSFIDFMAIVPLRVVYFLFSPFPWELPSAADAFIALDGIFYVILISAALWSLVRGHAMTPVWPIFAAIFTMVVVFSFGTSNSGTAFRHRAKIAPLLIAVSASLARPRRPTPVRAIGPSEALPQRSKT